jgi:hypothetical protein
MCVFVYKVDTETQPLIDKQALEFIEIYIFGVKIADFHNNPRGLLGTRTSTLGRQGIKKLRSNWVYRKS